MGISSLHSGGIVFPGPSLGGGAGANRGRIQGSDQGSFHAGGKAGQKGDGQGQNPALAAAMQQAEDQFSRQKGELDDRTAHVVAHENAHASTAGDMAGGITLNSETRTFTMPDGTTRTVSFVNSGSVPISMPGIPGGVPKSEAEAGKLRGLLERFQRARAAALAPGDPSGADMSVAAKASAGEGRVNALLAQFDPTKAGKDGQKGQAPGGRLNAMA